MEGTISTTCQWESNYKFRSQEEHILYLIAKDLRPDLKRGQVNKGNNKDVMKSLTAGPISPRSPRNPRGPGGPREPGSPALPATPFKQKMMSLYQRTQPL